MDMLFEHGGEAVEMPWKGVGKKGVFLILLGSLKNPVSG